MQNSDTLTIMLYCWWRIKGFPHRMKPVNDPPNTVICIIDPSNMQKWKSVRRGGVHVQPQGREENPFH